MRRSRRDLKVAESNFENDFLPDAVNRAYFAVYHAASACLLSEGLKPKTHGGVISEFGRVFIKTGEFEKELGQILNELEEERVMADYMADPEFLVEEVEIHLENARTFVQIVGEWFGLESESSDSD